MKKQKRAQLVEGMVVRVVADEYDEYTGEVGTIRFVVHDQSDPTAWAEIDFYGGDRQSFKVADLERVT